MPHPSPKASVHAIPSLENQQQAPVWSLPNAHGETNTDLWAHRSRKNDHWNLGDRWGKKAIEKGYILDTIYEVWHFDRISQNDPQTKLGGAFTDYVNTFLKMKQEASALPKWCQTEEDRYKYIEEYFQREGIHLEYRNIVSNPGHRALAKLMLNSFWGKFGQRENMPKTTYVTDPCEYFDMLTCHCQQLKEVSYVSEEMVRIQWILDDDFVETRGRTNVVITAYTTAQARLKLYSYLL